MRVRFWGTRGSIAKAGPGTVRYGGNTSCVEVRSDAGTLVVLDCGTGAHGLGQALIRDPDAPRRGYILVSHTHWDHIQGLPFFAPFFEAGFEWHVYGPRGLGASLREVLAGQMEYTYFPVTLDEFAAAIDYHDLVEGVFEFDDVRVTTRYLNHPALTLGYRLEVDGASVVYSSDHEPHARELADGLNGPLDGEDERHRRFVAGADLLIHDTQYTAEEYPEKVGWGHSTLEYTVDTAIAAGVGCLALFHHDPMRDDAAVDRLLERARERIAAAGSDLRVVAAAEGDEMEFRRSAGERAPAPAEVAPAADVVPVATMRDRTVLVAVADEATAAVLGEAARADGLKVAPCADPESAVRLAGEIRPALILLDRDLAGPEPAALCRALGDAARDGDPVPVVMVADADAAAERSAVGEGVTDWLVKPFTEGYARTRIRAWMMRAHCRWVRAPLPADEEQRLSALHALRILDTPPEERFDRYTRIAAAVFDVPVAFVSLVDRDRQWFKSRHGTDAAETPRDVAFCAHAILDDEVFVVPDALNDDRFADNPLVTGDPHVRFYAGVPLSLADGSRAGTLCVIDHRPRQPRPEELALLRDLGRLVERELSKTAPTWTTEPT